MGILALGPDRRGLCFHSEISWFSRGPSELGMEGSVRKKRGNTCKLPKNVIIKNVPG